MQFHKFAEIFPKASPAELQGLIDSIKKVGLLHPILTYQGQILDGRNREIALAKCPGVSPVYEEFKGNDSEALDRVWAEGNSTRRNLDQNEISKALAKYRKLMGECINQGGDRRSENFKASRDALKTQQEAAKAAGISRSSLQRAEAVYGSGNEELIKEVDAGKKSINSACEEVRASIRSEKQAEKKVEEVIKESNKEEEKEVKKEETKKETFVPKASDITGLLNSRLVKLELSPQELKILNQAVNPSCTGHEEQVFSVKFIQSIKIRYQVVHNVA